ncbi:hypothetical protein CVT24_005668, partial [Panaeolus cyanescens]
QQSDGHPLTVIREDSDNASSESLHGGSPPPPFTPAPAPITQPISAQSVPMPGSFAPPAYVNTGDNATNPAVQATASTQNQNTGSLVDAPNRVRRSPNPFVTTTPARDSTIFGSATNQQVANISPFPLQLGDVNRGNTHTPLTPRITVPVMPGRSTLYHSPEASGQGNFGPSVTHHELWGDSTSPQGSESVAVQEVNTNRSHRTIEERGHPNLSDIQEDDEELEYVDDILEQDTPRRVEILDESANDGRPPAPILIPDIEDPRRG